MNVREHIPGGDWSGPRTVFEDEYGNRGEVRWPRLHAYGIRGHDRWDDATVHLNSQVEDGADEVGAVSEFLWELAHVGKTLDLAFADDKAEALVRVQREQDETDLRKKVEALALERRCQDVAQFYMQMVRVQREGHRANANGELHVSMTKDDDSDTERVQPRMWLKERSGNLWRFKANEIAKFEVKDGSRYEVVRLTPMARLEADARKELSNDAEAQQRV